MSPIAMMLFKKLLILTSIALTLSSTADSDALKVRLITTLGNIDLVLYQKKAPLTVGNFLKYVDANHYQDGSFVRTVRKDNDNGSPKIAVIQGKSREGVTLLPAIKLETTAITGIQHTDGVISMARGEPDTAQDQFFITIGAQPSLDFGGMRNPDAQGFAAFGKVIDGMSVVKTINDIRTTKKTDDAYTTGQYLIEPVKILDTIRLSTD